MKLPTYKILTHQNYLFQVCWGHIQAREEALVLQVRSASSLTLAIASRTEANRNA